MKVLTFLFQFGLGLVGACTVLLSLSNTELHIVVRSSLFLIGMYSLMDYIMFSLFNKYAGYFLFDYGEGLFADLIIDSVLEAHTQMALLELEEIKKRSKSNSNSFSSKEESGK